MAQTRASTRNKARDLILANLPRAFPVRTLLSLPAAIQIKIILYLDQYSLTQFLRTCWYLQNLGTPLLYRYVTFKPSRGLDFVRSLGGNRTLHQFIEALTVHDHHTADTRYSQILATTAMHLRNLKHLKIKCCFTTMEWVSPQDVAAQNRLYVETLRAPFLDRLMSLEIGLSQTDPWDMAARECIFRHPTLRKLCVVGCSMRDFHSFTPVMHHQTPLQYLRFLCCDIGPATLAKIVSVPHALQKFIMMGSRQDGEVQFADANAALYIEALKPQGHSLTHIYIGFWFLNPLKSSTLDFSHFGKLEEIIFTPYVLAHQRAGSPAHVNLLPLIAPNTPFPASLKVLGLYHLNPKTLSATETILKATLSRLVHSRALPNLTTVALFTPYFMEVPSATAAESSLDFLQNYALPTPWDPAILGHVAVKRVRITVMKGFPLDCECSDYHMGRVVLKS
ncbi:uncharacterized protein BDV14DRAFT_198234 [Aspergillus stella-maris]|uniref:uncharacterized protein n=1 Tax=Aspergillus stella-maris TaxID=1810926 RepID=UPI003CCD64F9